MEYPSILGDVLVPLPLPEVVYRRLHAAILNGVYKPGQMLRQEELAQSLGVSRAPLREALPRLEADGLVVQLPRRGYVVASLDPDEIREIFDLRKLIEGQAVAIATAKRQQEDIAKAEDVLSQMEVLDVQDSEQRIQWFLLNSSFHEALLMPSGCRHFIRSIVGLRTAVEPYIRVEISLTGNVEAANREHADILEAYRQQKVERVKRLTQEHIEHTAVRLLARLTSNVPL